MRIPDRAAQILEQYLKDFERLSPADRDRYCAQLRQCPLCAVCLERDIVSTAETARWFEAEGRLLSVCRDHAACLQ